MAFEWVPRAAAAPAAAGGRTRAARAPDTTDTIVELQVDASDIRSRVVAGCAGPARVRLVSEKVDIDGGLRAARRWGMRSSHVPIDADLLKSLYVEQRLTTVEIAGHLRCAATTIRRRLHEFQIPTRPRRSRAYGRRLPPSFREGSPAVAYAVGLIATDGNLSRDGRHLSVVPIDRDLLETLRTCLSLGVAIRPHSGGYGIRSYRVQWGDHRFYEWLVGIGLTPAKSLTLGSLAIPDAVFPDLVRGRIDGDGSVTVYVDTYNTSKSERYVYERLYVSLFSGSRGGFLDWIRAAIHRLFSLSGSITEKCADGKRPHWTLRYAKSESIELLRRIYHSPTVPCLKRKYVTAARFLQPLGHASVRPTGRPRAGWV